MSNFDIVNDSTLRDRTRRLETGEYIWFDKRKGTILEEPCGWRISMYSIPDYAPLKVAFGNNYLKTVAAIYGADVDDLRGEWPFARDRVQLRRLILAVMATLPKVPDVPKAEPKPEPITSAVRIDGIIHLTLGITRSYRVECSDKNNRMVKLELMEPVCNP